MSGVYGPALPPGFADPQSEEAENEAEDGTAALGPQLPKKPRGESPTRVYGPVLPPPPVASGAHDVCGPELDTAHTYGPKLPADTEVHEGMCHDNKESELHHI